MEATVEPKHVMNSSRSRSEQVRTGSEQPHSSNNDLQLTRLLTEDGPTGDKHSIFHVYSRQNVHKFLSPNVDLSRERYLGPKLKERKVERLQRKNDRQGSTSSRPGQDEDSFFLHRPYIAFHYPPRVLYLGSSRYARPVVLIHRSLLWGEYKLQLGSSLADPGVLDPRGVVSWRHNGGDKESLKADDRKLKGYKVRNWRLWGESGKEYVHSVKRNRRAGERPDPADLEDFGTDMFWPVKADEVVYLRWTNPFSRHTRLYHFHYVGLDFYWKGTGTVKESRRCGMMLRFNHLKLVAKHPTPLEEEGNDLPEVCLCKFTSSVASKKNGSLDFFDAAILRLIEERAPYMLASSNDTIQHIDELAEQGQAEKIARMKKSSLYQVLVATGMCMLISEKEKRHTLLDILHHGGEGAGGAGG